MAATVCPHLLDWELHIFCFALYDGDGIGIAVLLHYLPGPLCNGTHLYGVHMSSASLLTHTGQVGCRKQLVFQAEPGLELHGIVTRAMLLMVGCSMRLQQDQESTV